MSSHRIVLELGRIEEYFAASPPKMGDHSSRVESGFEELLGIVRSSASRGPLEVTIRLPSRLVSPSMSSDLKAQTDQWCAQRIVSNARRARATRIDGVSSLKVGLPVAVGGFLLALLRSQALGGFLQATEIAGGVVLWIGLWFPLDTIFFTPLSHLRENRALRRIQAASFSVEPVDTTPASD
jgi:hypothetical protein